MTVVMKVNPNAFSSMAEDISRLTGAAVKVYTIKHKWDTSTEYGITINGEGVSSCKMTARECWTGLSAMRNLAKANAARMEQP